MDIKTVIDLYENGTREDYIVEMYNNYMNLKNINNGLNPLNPDFSSTILLNSSFQKIYSPKFISDVIEYSGGMPILLDNKDDFQLQNLEKFLNDNNIYSKSIIHCILIGYDKIKNLLGELVEKNHILSENEKDIFIRLVTINNTMIIKDINFNLYNKSDKGIVINSIDELHKYNDKLSDYTFSEKNINEIRKNIYTILLGNPYPDDVINLSKNDYLKNELKKCGLINELSEGVIEIVGDIDTIQDVEEAKNKYKRIIESEINLFKTYEILQKNISNYFLSMFNNIEQKERFKKGNTSAIDYNNKKIPVYQLNGEKFMFLVHGVGALNGKAKILDIKSDPSYWNSLDVSSTISTSVISDKFISPISFAKNLAFGFCDLPIDSLLITKASDASVPHGYNVHYPTFRFHSERLHTPNSIMKNTGTVFIEEQGIMKKNYNEVGLYRKNANIKSNNKKIQPDFVVAFDSINENHKRAAAYFNIPIVVINTIKYEQQNKQKLEKYMNDFIENFDLNDAKEIMEYQDIPMEESINLIINNIENLNISGKEKVDFINEVKKTFINDFIDDSDVINMFIERINELNNKIMVEGDNYGKTK